MSLLDDRVTQDADGTWSFECPRVKGSLCGDLGAGVGFRTSGWPDREHALARGAQHFTEHKDPEFAMPSLEEFRAERGLTATPDGGVVRLEDLP